MLRSLLKISLIVCCSVSFLLTLQASATGGNVVIAQVQAGAATASPTGDAAATQEFISLYNNANTPVDITDWCVTNKLGTSFACLTPPAANVTLSLAPHGYALIASDSFSLRYKPVAATVFPTTNKTSGSITGGSDTLTLLDGNGSTIDTMGWTTAVSGGSVLSRSLVAGIMTDTDTNADFKKLAALAVPASGVTEEVQVIDRCVNINGIQPVVPDGYEVSSDGRCVIDVCPNLDDIQEAVPSDMTIDSKGRCVYVMPVLRFSELLPNAVGTDDGNEFIELYNPNETAVDLTRYRLQVGPNFEKTYGFPKNSHIDALSYASFANDSIDYTLLNTSSRVRLISVDEQVIDESPLYLNPAEDQAWSLLDGLWGFTNQPTPGLANLVSLDGPDEASVTTNSAKACASNQYRNPDTGRCRLIVTSDTPISACKDGQYRSEETNRCRNIASDPVAKACAENQFRNPDTGRCKKIASEDEARDCGEGRERNPTTNRCRNIVSANKAVAAGSGVALVDAPAAAIVGWWVGGAVVLILLGYAALEWRHEIGAFLYGRFPKPITAIRSTFVRIRSMLKR